MAHGLTNRIQAARTASTAHGSAFTFDAHLAVLTVRVLTTSTSFAKAADADVLIEAVIVTLACVLAAINVAPFHSGTLFVNAAWNSTDAILANLSG